MNYLKILVSLALALGLFVTANATIWQFTLNLTGPAVVNPAPNFNTQTGTAVLNYDDVTLQMTLVSMSTTQISSMQGRWGDGGPGVDNFSIVTFPPLIGPSLNVVLGTYPSIPVLSGLTFLQYNPGNTSGIVDPLHCERDQIANGIRLPVEMTSFSAVGGNNRVRLNWRTETESNNARFLLYRSTVREIRGDVIAQVDGNGTTPVAHTYSYVDTRVQNGTTYYYRISDVDLNGVERVHPMVVSALPSPQGASVIPVKFELAQNFPNPFNPTTSISYTLPEAGSVKLTVFDIMGHTVGTLVNGNQAASSYHVQFDGSKLPSGTYYYTLATNKHTVTKWMLLVK